MPIASRWLVLVIFAVITCCSLISFKIVNVLYEQPCSSCIKEQKQLQSVVFNVRYDSMDEFIAVTQVWQRWAEFAPCRPSGKPVNWETGQVNLTIAMSEADFAIEELLVEAWNNLPDRVKWCFLEPNFTTKSQINIHDIHLVADADLWPLTENWLNKVSSMIASKGSFSAIGHLQSDGSLLPQAIYNPSNNDIVAAINDQIGVLNGSVHEYRISHPNALFVIAGEGAVNDDF